MPPTPRRGRRASLEAVESGAGQSAAPRVPMCRRTQSRAILAQIVHGISERSGRPLSCNAEGFPAADVFSGAADLETGMI